MSEKKSLVEEALLQMQNLEEAIAQNAKGILASTMKQEISELVKESLKEQEADDEDMDAEDDDMEDMDADMEADDEDMDAEDADMEDMNANMGADDEDMDAEDDDMESDETETDMNSEEPLDLRGVSDEQLLKVFKAMGDEDGIVVTKDGDNIHLEDNNDDVEYMIDLGESDEEEMDESWGEEMDETEDEKINSILGKMFNEKSDDDDEMESDDDEMESSDEVVYEIHMDDDDDDEDEMNESDDEDEMNESDDEDDDDEDDDDEDDDDDDDDEDEMNESVTKLKKETKESFKKIKPKGVGMGKVKKSVFTQPVKKTETKEGSIMVKPKVGKGAAKVGGKNTEVFTKKPMGKKSETKEAARTLGNGKKWGRNGLDKPRTAPRHLAVESELKALREKNEEYRKALNIFREKLNEVAVFNSNLAYATRLFTEHSTTKQEKLNILRRFDGAETLKESKSLYKSIKDELSSNEKPIVKESIEKKIEKVQSTGSSINLIESKTYENPQFLRMKDLMSKIK